MPDKDKTFSGSLVLDYLLMSHAHNLLTVTYFFVKHEISWTYCFRCEQGITWLIHVRKFISYSEKSMSLILLLVYDW